MSSEFLPSPMPWKKLEKAMPKPAAGKHRLMVRRAEMPMSIISALALNIISRYLAPNWKISRPTSMMPKAMAQVS